MRSLRLATLRRSGRGWSPAIAVGRRELRSSSLGAILARRRAHTRVHHNAITKTRMTQVVTAAAPLTVRTAGVVYLAVAAAPGRVRHLLPAGWSTDGRVPPVVPPLARPLVQSIVQRERLVQHTRTEQTAGQRGPAGPAGPAGAEGPATPAPPPLVLRHAAPPPVLAASGESGIVLAAPPGTVELLPPPAAPQLAAPAPTVDVLAAQVLEQIERRAIAQRERMGRI